MDWLPARAAAIARSEPGRVALSEAGRDIGYGEFWSGACALAGWLHAAGVQRGDRVASVLPNGHAAALACYGAWLAGAVHVPLGAQARAKELGNALRHCGARVLLHEAGNVEVAAALATLDAPPLRIATGDDHTADTTLTQALTAPAAFVGEVDPDAPAAILYTSGTTGAPKGVTLSARNLAANTSAIVAYLGLTGDDSIVAALPFHYAYGSSLLHTHLAVGARLVVASNFVFPHALVEDMARERVTGFAGVPSTYALLLDRVPLRDYDLSALRYLTQAGGAMSPALTQRLRAALPAARLFVMYGQTEATARLTWLPPERLDDKLGSVGVALDGVTLSIRDAAGEPLPAGAEGEVWARGDNVMLGYWNDADATSRALREDGWLRTGDVGQLDDDGFLWLAGRRSDMIKTGAHRVHPAEIEETIAELPGVREVAVCGVDDPVLGQAIRASVVADDGARDANRIKAHCRARLAPHKLPREVVFVDALPRTASGKVRRAALSETVSTTPSLSLREAT